MAVLDELLAVLQKHIHLLIIAVILGRWIVKKYGNRHLRSIPGPFLAGFTRLWYLLEVRKGSMEKSQIKLHRKYGPVVRLTPNIISIDDPEAIKSIYGSGAGPATFIKAPWYYASAHPDRSVSRDMFQEMDPKRHAEKRRKVAAFYTMSAILDQERYVDSCIFVLIQKLQGFADAGEVVDLGEWVQFYAFDVIGEVTLAERLGYLESGSDLGGMIRVFDKYHDYLAQVGIYPELHPLMHFFIRQLGGNKRRVTDFTQNCIDRRLAEKGRATDRKDFLTKFLALHDADPQYFTEEEVFMSCRQNLGAGSGSTAITLRSVIYHLCKAPDAMEKLRKEIDEMSSHGEISDPVTFHESTKMPYLQAVLKESQRMHTSTGLILGRVVPPGGAYLAGRYFPAGTTVGVSPWVAHRNREVFGPDADEFRPERWLDEKAARKMDRYFMPFGPIGPRACLGRNIAMMEITKVIPQLVKTFDFSLANPERAWKTWNMWTVKQTDFKVLISPRKA